MRQNEIQVGTRVIRYAHWRSTSGVGGPVRGTVIKIEREPMFQRKCSLVRWDSGTEQLMDNRDLRKV